MGPASRLWTPRGPLVPIAPQGWRLDVAEHEARHAVAAYRLGCRLYEASIDAGGREGTVWFLPRYEAPLPENFESRAVVHLAAVAVERLCGAGHLGQRGGHDEQRAAELAIELERAYGRPAPETLAGLAARALGLMLEPLSVHMVEAIARDLRRVGKLSGAGLVGALRSAESWYLDADVMSGETRRAA